MPDGHPVAVSDQGRAEQAGLVERPREQPLGRVTADVQASGAKARALPVDQRRGPEPLLESAQLTPSRRPFLEIHEVDGDAPLREEAERLARVLAVLEAEDLDYGAD